VVAAVALASTVSCLLAAAAFGSVVTASDGADVRGSDLSVKQREAFDIEKVTAIGSALGLVVVVDFRGNIERTLGVGPLLLPQPVKHALAALVLEPLAPPDVIASGRLSPARAVLATTGSGPVGHTLQRASTIDVGVGRDGDKLTFVLFGLDLSSFARIKVGTVVPAKSQMRQSPQKTGEVLIQEAVGRGFPNPGTVDEAALAVPSAAIAECASVRAAITELDRQAFVLQEKMRKIEERIRDLARDINLAEGVIKNHPRTDAAFDAFTFLQRARPQLATAFAERARIKGPTRYFTLKEGQMRTREQQVCVPEPVLSPG
jgi:hypothetical protein